MTNQVHFFKEVTLLITHYNRSASLERLLSSFESLGCSFGQIVVSDDCSEEEHLHKIIKLKNQFCFDLATSSSNGGMARNINRGQDKVKSKYTLYIQEDFVPKPAFVEHFSNALKIMDEDSRWDLITFYSTIPYPYLKKFKLGFSEKRFSMLPWFSNHLKFYLYGDNPLLRRTSFFEKFGRYPEGNNGDQSEMEMSLTFISKNGKALFFEDNYSLFDHENSEEEPSTANFRKDWRQSKTLPIQALRWFYLKGKFLKLNLMLLNKIIRRGLNE